MYNIVDLLIERTMHAHLVFLNSRSSDSAAAEWWPGGIHSPIVYFHLRARQLRHQQRYPPRDGSQQWRLQAEVTALPSELLARRGQAPAGIHIPVACTNVSQGDGMAHHVGERSIALKQPSRAGSVGPPGTDATHFEKTSDSKRRCTEMPSSSVAAGGQPYALRDGNHTPLLASRHSTGHLIARAPTPPPQSALLHASPYARQGIPVYPGVVLQHQPGAQTGTGIVPSVSGALGPLVNTTNGVTVVTPPIAPPSYPPSGTLLSASSDVSTASLAPMSTGSEGIGSYVLPSNDGMGSTVAPPPTSTTIPVLVMQRGSGMPSIGGMEDPTMKQYYLRQYTIKQEQAFPCHHVVDLATVAGEQSQPREQGSVAWVSMLRSIADTLKRTVSP